MGAGAERVVGCGGARAMRRRLTAAVIAALIALCLSGCHVHVTVHADPALHSVPAGR